MGDPTRKLPLTDEDITAMVRLLGDVAGSLQPLAQRRKILMERLVALVEADTWMWVCSRHDGRGESASPLFVLDGGWLSDVERTNLWHANTQKELLQAITVGVDLGRHATFAYDDTHAGWSEGVHHLKHIRSIGFDHILLSLYPLSDRSLSGIGVHRRVGREPFTARQIAIVHLIASQIDWLHRAGSDVAANDDTLLTLSTRQREVLVHMLGGDSRKQVALKLKLSEYTVDDHIKGLYKRMGVKSNTELLAKFLPGGIADDPNPANV